MTLWDISICHSYPSGKRATTYTVKQGEHTLFVLHDPVLAYRIVGEHNGEILEHHPGEDE